MITSTRGFWVAGLLAVLLLPGCSEPTEQKTADSPPVLRALPSDEPEVILPSELRRKMKANEKAKFQKVGDDIVGAELFQSGVKSIEALRGLPLRFLDLGMTEVTDLSPIEGMDLKTLILENTDIDDLSCIKGMQLEVLQLQNTKVTDLSPINGMPIRELNLLAVPIDNLAAVAKLPLETLWVPQTNVTDISPLKGKPMVSLDIQGTKVASIEPLAGMTTLKRLNIADCLVTDLVPLEGIKLERITLSPQTITKGIEVLRSMPSLATIVTSMQNPRQSSAEFWRAYDAGVWSQQPDKEQEKEAAQNPTPEDLKKAEEKFEKLLDESEDEDSAGSGSTKSSSEAIDKELSTSDGAEEAGEKANAKQASQQSAKI